MNGKLAGVPGEFPSHLFSPQFPGIGKSEGGQRFYFGEKRAI
jgi:hypothetical protein